jgi:hypothetical protein
MATSSVAPSAHPSTRESRGLQLFRDHAEEIVFEDGVWLVPSQHDTTSVYEVTIGRRGESCECEDFEHRGIACKHIHAAIIARAKTASCAGCGGRFRHRELYPVPGDNLTFFEGELLCRSCGLAHGVL